jgi:hypothetical protein
MRTALCEPPSHRNYFSVDKKNNLCINIEMMEVVVKNMWCMGASGAVEAPRIASNIY